MTDQSRLLKIQSLVVEVLRDLMRSRITHTDEAINRAIARIGEYCNRDRAYVFSIGGGRTSNTHEWCAAGIQSHIDDLQDMPVEMFGEIYDILQRREIFHAPDVGSLSADSSARQVFEMQGIRSIVMVPMFEDGVLRGLVGFDAVQNIHAFAPEELELLQSVSDVISNAIMRKHREDARLKALDEARRANAAKSTFLARMSHELRTPLNGVIGIADLLQMQLEDQDQREMVAMMRESGSLLLDIINDLLDISKIEAELVVLRKRRIDMIDVFHRACATHRLRAQRMGLNFDAEIRGDAHSARIGDDKRIAQILHNIIGNAVKFTREGGISVLLDCSDPGNVEIRVRDTGIGISPEDLPTIFDEFVQADVESVYAHGGTGLGLPISKRLVEMMGGSVRVASELGKGSEFVINLALRMPREGTIELSAHQGSDDSRGMRGMPGLRVLLADDSPANRTIMTKMLEKLSASVLAVEDGAQALDAWKAADFDLIILDISMPVLNGIEAMKAIRACAEGTGRALPPIIAFTAHAMDHQIESYLEAGFEQVITKPVSLQSLAGCLQNLGYQSDIARSLNAG